MPTYQYACTSCGERLEVVQKFSDDPLTVCPVCSGALRKVFSPVGVVFKGSGFYKTDSRSSARKNADPEKKDSEKKDAAKKDATTSETASKETKTSESTSAPSGSSPTGQPSSSGQVA